MRVSNQEIEAAKSARGGWTKKTLAAWNVPWPPPRGWRAALRTGRVNPKRKMARKFRKFAHFHKRGGDLYWDREWQNAMDREA